uniref:Aa_trans domain-containing protein n=1 Tax=Heterorhabditis bacteriophora TaxID=37862 RepID=A0A1I7XV05_HETBA
MAVMYGPVCIMGYLTYGNSLRDSIIPSIQTLWIQQAINILITVHCILTLTIVFNPLNQEIEDLFKIPQNFCWQRVIIRSGIMVAVVFVAESLPTFGPLLDLVGGSTLTLTSIILPCLFYMYLSAARTKEEVTGIKDDSPCSYKDVTRQGQMAPRCHKAPETVQHLSAKRFRSVQNYPTVHPKVMWEKSTEANSSAQ